MPAADEPPTDAIEALVAGRYIDPATGDQLGAESRAIAIADSLAGREAELVGSLGIGPRFALLCDPNTAAVLGNRVCGALEAARYSVEKILLDDPVPDSATVAKLASTVPEVDAVIAVGSGTLNDLSKMLAFERNIPQLVFATAPSMNGYTSVSASIVGPDGLKRSYRTRTPVAAFFDLDVLAAAPQRLIRAGLGDSACRGTAQADWLLSHLLLDRPYRELPFALLAADEAELFAQVPALMAGDRTAMRHLVRTLVLSGFGMTLSGGSFPASQGEHLISHYLEMMAPPGLELGYHGEQIGVCTIEMAKLQERVLALGTAPQLRPNKITRDDLVAHYGEASGDASWVELVQKRIDGVQVDLINARLARDWDKIAARLRAVTIAPEAVASVLRAAGAATTPAELGIPDELWGSAVLHARELRNRYTFLDLALDGL